MDRLPQAEFLGGAAQPSLLAAAGAVLVCALLVGAAVLWATPVRLVTALGPGRLLTSAEDDAGYASLQVFDYLAHPPAPGTLLVPLTGPSDTGMALSSAEDLQQLISDELDRPVRVLRLTYPRQYVWESVALVDVLGSFQGITLIGVGPIRLSAGARQLAERLHGAPFGALRLGFRSDLLDDEARRLGVAPPPRFGLYFLDNIDFMRARLAALARTLVTGPVHFTSLQYGDKAATPEELEHQLHRMSTGRLLQYHDEVEANLDVIGRYIQRHNAAGRGPIALVELTTNDRYWGEIVPAEIQEDYDARIQEFAADHGVALWNLDDEAGLTEDDYYDAHHLRTGAGQRRYTAVLARHVAELARQELP